MFSISELFVAGRKSTIDGPNDLLRKIHAPVSSSEDHFDRRREAAGGKNLTFYVVDNIFQFFERHVCFGLPSLSVPVEIKVEYITLWFIKSSG